LYAADSKTIVGVLRTTLRLKTLLDTLNVVRLGQTGRMELFIPGRQKLAGAGEKPAPVDAMTVTQIEAAAQSDYIEMTYDNLPSLVSQAPVVTSNPERAAAIVQLGWVVVVHQDRSEGLAPLLAQTRGTTLLLLVIAAVVTGAAIGAAQVLSGPITRLITATQRVSAGDLTAQARVEAQDEIGMLANAFNSMVSQLQQTLSGLEQRVADRTAELSQASASLGRRVNQLQASSEVSRAVTTLTDPEQLIPQVVELIQQRFDFYYVGLFLVDADNRYAVLQAGMGAGSAHEAGRTMKERDHRLEVGSQSMVGWVCANKQARIALDVGDEPVRFANPLLPDTHSEMALPLRVGERVLGALDVQSTQKAAFDENDVAALQSMADQVAVALENARLFQQTQTALKDLEATNRLLVRQGWQEYLGEAKATRRAEFRAAGLPGQEAGASGGRLTVPLELRGQLVGRLALRREGDHPWSEEDIQMVRTVVLQTALAADNARLFEATQGALDESRALYRSSREITAAGEMSEVLSAVLDNLGRTGIHAAAVALFDAPRREEAKHIELVGAWDYKGTPRLAPGVRFAIADFPLFKRITSEETLVSSDLLADPEIDDMARTVLGGLGLRAMAITPLVVRGQWIGVLFALVEQPHTFTPAEINFQRALADQAAVAIDSRRLFADVQHRAEREALVRQITTRIRAAGDIQGVLETTATELARSMGVPRAIVRLTMGDKDAFTEKEL
jgi:GAF domain-containing protein/HAMP domain-containing protein